MRYFLRYIVSAANDLVAIPLVLLIHVMWGTNLRMEGPNVCTNLKPDSWPVDPSHILPFAGWYEGWGGTTFGHAIMYGVAPSKLTRLHEHVHVEQCEAAMLKSLLIGLLVLPFTGKIWLAYCVWSSGYAFYIISNWVVAALHGKSIYWGSIHEEHAYEQSRSSATPPREGTTECTHQTKPKPK